MITKIKRLKIGDSIKIITGTEKGFIGKIAALFPKKSLVIVEGVLPRIKKVKKEENKSLPKLIHSSNVMLWDPTKNQCSRIAYRVLNNEKKRYLKKTGTFL